MLKLAKRGSCSGVGRSGLRSPAHHRLEPRHEIFIPKGFEFSRVASSTELEIGVYSSDKGIRALLPESDMEVGQVDKPQKKKGRRPNIYQKDPIV
jgi:hypothetical protein